MGGRLWIRLLPWLRKNRPESNSAPIKFAPRLELTRESGWVYLELLLANRSSWTVWVQEATVVLTDLEAEWQAASSNGQAKYEILQNVVPHETLSVSLARTIYDAAGRPQGPYSCLVSTTLRYRVLDEWCSAKLATHHVEMAALTVVSLHSARWYDKKMKKIDDSAGLATRGHKG